MKEILLFSKALNKSELTFEEVNKQANKYGYIIHEDCCNERVFNWIDTLPVNYGSTFYQNWEDVITKDRFELFIDQIKHYASTYGTDFTGDVYLPNSNPTIVAYEDYKVILPITKEEIGNKIQNLFNSGIALSQKTIDDCFELLNEFELNIKIDQVKNKEVLMYLYLKTDTLPTKPEEMVRYMVFCYTGKTLLIKDPETISAIKNNRNKLDIEFDVERFGIEKLSSVFHRFKPIFLAMKKGNEKTINKLRKLADKYHKPYEFGYFETILSGKSDLSKLMENIKYLSNYKKIVLLQTIKIRQEETGILPILVRNQKLFIKEQKLQNKNYYQFIYDAIYNSLIADLSKKACKIKLHPTINLSLPTSEKSFIGNIPFGSYVKIGEENSVVGINWKSVDGANDLDLSLMDVNNNKFGWDSSYYNDETSVIYSGDMTSANPEATELLYCKKGLPNSVVKVNLYSGSQNSKFTVFFAKTDDKYTVKANTMVNPNDVVFATQLEMNSKEMLCGIIIDNKFYFSNIRTGNKRISNGNSITTNYIDYCTKTKDCYLDLEKVLSDAGFEFVTKDETIDLSTLDKGTLIDLLKS